jgi:hypothetical protein
MKLAALAAGVLSCVLASAVVASAQLGDVARKEAERRKAAKASGKTSDKTYTNDNLPSAPSSSSSAPASSGTQSSAGTPPASSSASTPAGSKASGVSSDPEQRKKDEAQWRERIKGERDALERAKTFADALQSKINALNTDYVNRDDPAQRSVIAANRDKALGEMGRLKKEIADHTKAINSIQEEARRSGVPAGWVR